MRIISGGFRFLLIIIAAIIIPGGGFVLGGIGWWIYNGRQGERDKPLLRFARMLGMNDPDVVEMANLFEINPTAAWQKPDIARIVGRLGNVSQDQVFLAILHYAADIRIGHPRLEKRLAVFDWKDNPGKIAEAFHDMLTGAGLKPPSNAQRDTFLAEAAGLADDMAITALIARYDDCFRSGGYQLTLVNTGSTSYHFVVLPMKTAKCWNGVGFATRPGTTEPDLVIEPAILQSVGFIKTHAQHLRPLLVEGFRRKPMPGSACLPRGMVFKDMLFGQPRVRSARRAAR